MMKKSRFIVWLLLAALLASMLVGCGGEPSASERTSAPTATTPEPGTATEPDTAMEPAVTPDPDAEQAYQEAMRVYESVMDQNCDIIYNGIRDGEEYPYVSSGLMESAMYQERAELLQNVGYLFEDISGDGIPELLIGLISNETSEVKEQLAVFGGYTCKDGEPVCFLEGWGRNFYQWLGDGRFYNFGSGGAAYSAFGVYRISPNGTELLCEDFYFTEPNGTDYSDVGYYHNTTGEWDKNAAEKIDIDSDAFWALSDQYEAEAQTLDLTPFADYEYTGYVAQPLSCKVRADYLDDAAYKYSYYDDASEYFATDGQFETTVLFQSDEDIADFRLLSLTLRDVDADGHATFDVAEVFDVSALRAGIPLAVPMSFPGDIPSNGFSYTDTDGMTKTYTISTSGRDGLLEIAPLD